MENFVGKGGQLYDKSDAYLGLDAGSASIDLVLIDSHGNVIESAYHLASPETGNSYRHRNSCDQCCEMCADPCGASFIATKIKTFISSCHDHFDIEIKGCCGTGSQIKKKTPLPIHLDLLVSEVSAHARGMQYASNTDNIEAIIDVGGQDSKVMRLSSPLDFNMSGLCSAGTGTYLDEISRVEKISVSKFGEIGAKYIKRYIESLSSDAPLNIDHFSSVCTVFTKTSYVKKKSILTLEERVAAICWAQARQIYNSVINHLRDYDGQISFQGGVSFNSGVKMALDYLLKKGRSLPHDAMTILIVPEIKTYCDDNGHKKPVSHLMGALGAALLAKEYIKLSMGQKTDTTHHPVPLKSSIKRKNLLKKQIALSKLQGESRPQIAWCGTLFPSEICYLFDMIPVALPVLAAVDHKNAHDNLLSAARTEGVDRANCTILSAILGRLDRTPAPDFIFHTSGSCDYYRQHMIRLIDIAHERFGIDKQKQVCSIDLPAFNYENDLNLKFVADQLKDAVAKVEDTIKVKHDPDKLRTIIENVNQARYYHVLTEKLRAKNDMLAAGSELLKRCVLYSSAWGCREFVDITRSYYEEIAERAKNISGKRRITVSRSKEKHRILWVYLWDYTDPGLFHFIEVELNCAIVAEELNHIHWPKMVPKRPFESIARRIVQPINHINSRISYLTEMAEKYRVDGIIFFVHFFAHCPLASETVQHQLRISDYPVLFLEGDCLDKSRRPANMLTKVQAFVEQLNKKKYGNIFGFRSSQSTLRARTIGKNLAFPDPIEKGNLN